MNNRTTNAHDIRAAFENITNSPEQRRAESVIFLNSITATDAAGLDQLVAGIHMPDIDIKISSALALGRVAANSASAIEALQDLLEDTKLMPEVRQSAAAALVEMSTPLATESLVKSLKAIAKESDFDPSFWSFSLRTLASSGALVLPHLDLFEALKNTFSDKNIPDTPATINIGRVELSRSIDRDFSNYITHCRYQSPAFGSFLDENCELPPLSKDSSEIGEYKLQFDERVSFTINAWAHGPATLEADTRLVVLQPKDTTKKPLIIICHDEMTHNFLLIDAQDIVKQISRHLDTKAGAFDWATYSSPTKDNSNYEGSLRITDYKSPVMILNSMESEYQIGSSYREITKYLRTVPNPPAGFYDFAIKHRENLAIRRNRSINQGNHF